MDVEILQKDLDYISNWPRLWFLKLNILKCYVMHLGRGNNNIILCMIRSRGGYRIYKRGGGTNSGTNLLGGGVRSTLHAGTRGVWGHPQENLKNRC